MLYLSFVFLIILSVNTAAQSPAVSKLFSDGTRQANQARFDEALNSYKTALFRAEEEYVGKGYRARLHYNIGVCLFHLDRYQEATEHFKQSILLDQAYTRAHYALGMAETRKRNWKRATVSFTRLLDLDPKNGEAWFDLAFASLALNDLAKAELAFANSIRFASRDAALSHNNIGVILAVRGDLAAAETRFENAIAMSSGKLHEAKRNLEFCRVARQGRSDLVAFEYARRNAGLDLS
jgi:tetratricopeptide (TPR) repeat protein